VLVSIATGTVDTPNDTELAPAGTVTTAGTEAAKLELSSCTVAPPAGAGPVNVTVPVTLPPPSVAPSESVSIPAHGGFIVSAVVAEFAEVAVIPAVVIDPTAIVVTLNVLDTEPCGTTIDPGTEADPELLARFTSTPPTGAAAANITVPIEDCPPINADGERLKLDIVPCPGPAGLIVSVAVVEFADVAVIVTDPAALVVTANVPDTEPCGMVSEPGTEADPELLANVTSTPPAGAAPDKVTVPVEG
jgi:hypothetical protein